MMEDRTKVPRSGRRKPLSGLPEELLSQCHQIAKDLRTRNEMVRDEKILAARVRICSGYYDSEHVIRIVASRLLSEGNR
jgi:hypothetical protein